MPVLQRSRGVWVSIYPSVVATDRRGNSMSQPVTTPLTVRAWFTPDRSAKAEVPGQQHINVYKMGTTASLEGVDMWSRVEWAGKWWDIVAPPAHHIGTRHTRHWTVTIRERPDDGGL